MTNNKSFEENREEKRRTFAGIVTRMHFDGLSTTEIALKTGYSEASVRKAIEFVKTHEDEIKEGIKKRTGCEVVKNN